MLSIYDNEWISKKRIFYKKSCKQNKAQLKKDTNKYTILDDIEMQRIAIMQ